MSKIRKLVIEKCIKELNDANKSAKLEYAHFGLICGLEKSCPLPTNENDVTDFIKKRTSLYMESWIISRLDHVINLLESEINR